MYTYNKTEEIIRSNTVEELTSKFTKQQLIDMHLEVYNLRPLSASNKENIAHTLKQYFYQIDRALAFKI